VLCAEPWHPRTGRARRAARQEAGHGGTAQDFAKGYKNLLSLAGGTGVAIGTDANGLYPLPRPSPVVYGDSFPRYRFGREWDYNNDGFAHYGMFPDFLRSAFTSSDPQQRLDAAAKTAFMTSAEDFALMWEKTEQRARAIRSSAGGSSTETSIVVLPDATGGFCPHGAVRGDAEFGGHGPRVSGTVTLEVASGGTAVRAKVALKFAEPVADWSEVGANFERIVYRAAAGVRIVRIESTAVTNVDTTLNGGGRNEVFQGCDGDEHNVQPGNGPVKSIRLVGDTGGGDISGDTDCNCDTRISEITFNNLALRTARR
jgi:hypothetical protein